MSTTPILWTPSCYKPVPPPKPYPLSPSNADGAGLPHILVTPQGHFQTHSTKFPIESLCHLQHKSANSNNSSITNLQNNLSSTLAFSSTDFPLAKLNLNQMSIPHRKLHSQQTFESETFLQNFPSNFENGLTLNVSNTASDALQNSYTSNNRIKPTLKPNSEARNVEWTFYSQSSNTQRTHQHSSKSGAEEIQLRETPETFANTSTNLGFLEFIKTHPTDHITGLANLTRGTARSCVDIYSTVIGNGKHEVDEADQNQKGFRIVGAAGTSGSIVVVRKGGSLPRLPSSCDKIGVKDLESCKGIGKLLRRYKTRQKPDTIFQTPQEKKTPRPQQPLPPHAVQSEASPLDGPSRLPPVGGSDALHNSEQEPNMPSARPGNVVIPPEGTLAGLLPQHYHPQQPHRYGVQQYNPANSQNIHKGPPDYSYNHGPMKNHSENGPSHNPAPLNGDLGIPIAGDSGAHQTDPLAREAWSRTSQGLRRTESHAISGHHHNGHIPNGHLRNGGPTENGYPPAPPPKPTHNGGHCQWGHLNHGFQHTTEGGMVTNGYRDELHGHPFPNGHQPYNRQHNQNNEEHIHLNSMPKISPNTRISDENCRGPPSNFNGTLVPQTHEHSPMSTNSAPADEINSANERQEEQRKDDRWGSLKRGLKYTSIKGIITSKLNGRSETKDDQKNEINKHVTNAHKQSSRENSPSKKEKNTNIGLQNGLNHNSNQSKPGYFENSSREVPTNSMNGFHHGNQLRSSVHFDLPNSIDHPQMGFANSVNGNTLPQCPGLHQPNQQTQLQQLRQPSQRQAHGLQHAQSQQQLWRQQNKAFASEMIDVLPSDQTYGANGRTASAGTLSTATGVEGSSSADSGRGTAASGGAPVGGDRRSGHNTSVDSGASSNRQLGHSSGNDSEWVDMTDGEANKLQHRGHENFPSQSRGSQRNLPHVASKKGPTAGGPSNAPLMGTANLGAHRANGLNASRRSLVRRESFAATPPLPALSPDASPPTSPHGSPSRGTERHQRSYSSSALNQPDLLEAADRLRGGHPPEKTKDNFTRSTNGPMIGEGVQRWRQDTRKHHFNLPPLLSRHSTGRLDIDPSELTEGTDVLDLDSMLEGNTEATSDEEASTYDPDVNLIRKQLEGLEGMYSEVLKLLGGNNGRKLKSSRRRLHGSMSSLPSSIVSNTRTKDKRKSGGLLDDRLKRGAARDGGKGIQRRFQRLESHVVTLARSVAHLSSEMRSQNAIFQEMESIRNDIAALRTAGVPQNHIATNPVRNGAIQNSKNSWDIFKMGGPGLNNPGRVKKLTQFFGDEPPLVRLFLRKLGYEKYAQIFEHEKIGMLELPYLDEERLLKLGIPLGPRVRIMQEAQGPITTDGNLSVYVV
ncbi:Sterile alpha motif domain [Trinorchestia longiramus]|nr:Sterile alpha motif domain [Trinorchestia longiramus]